MSFVIVSLKHKVKDHKYKELYVKSTTTNHNGIYVNWTADRRLALTFESVYHGLDYVLKWLQTTNDPEPARVINYDEAFDYENNEFIRTPIDWDLSGAL